MIVSGGSRPFATVLGFVRSNARVVLVVLGLEALAWAVHRRFPELEVSVLAAGAVGLLATVVGIFLAFRINEAYARWWEARILWGGVVNYSRTFARQVTTLLTGDRLENVDVDQARREQRVLVYRHLAWVNALRLSLRDEPVFPEVDPWLPDEERASMRAARNAVTALGQAQSRHLARLVAATTAEHVLLSRLDETLADLTDAQGGLERIKRTVFPERVVMASWALVWIVALMVSFALLDPPYTAYGLKPAAVFAIVLSLVAVKKLGDELKDPFEGQPNDTPMTAICRTIEIDLRQLLGEEEVPSPLLPENGVLN